MFSAKNEMEISHSESIKILQEEVEKALKDVNLYKKQFQAERASCININTHYDETSKTLKDKIKTLKQVLLKEQEKSEQLRFENDYLTKQLIDADAVAASIVQEKYAAIASYNATNSELEKLKKEVRCVGDMCLDFAFFTTAKRIQRCLIFRRVSKIVV